MHKTVELPLSRNYIRDWGVKEAVRELIQNAIDSPTAMEYAFIGDTLTIGNRDVTLDHKTLILGNTSKANDSSKIGNFGEGYKLALLVLAREGIPVTVRNGNQDWIPSFRHSDTYGDEVLCIDMFEVDTYITDRLEFRITGLNNALSNEIYDSCLIMQPEMPDAIKTKRGQILPSRPGKLYVGSLYVCDTELTYGYDISPDYIQLDRDRMAVSTFDLKIITKEMWFDTAQWDEVAVKMEEGIPDLEYAGFGAPELVKEACYRQFSKQHPGAIVANSHKEMQEMVAKGMTKVVQVNSSSYYSAVSSSDAYKRDISHITKNMTPQEHLKSWAERNQRMMSLPLRQEFKKVIEEAGKWKI